MMVSSCDPVVVMPPQKIKVLERSLLTHTGRIVSHRLDGVIAVHMLICESFACGPDSIDRCQLQADTCPLGRRLFGELVQLRGRHPVILPF